VIADANRHLRPVRNLWHHSPKMKRPN
jgi:hypothetical protein